MNFEKHEHCQLKLRGRVGGQGNIGTGHMSSKKALVPLMVAAFIMQFFPIRQHS